MTLIYRTPDSERLLRERYRALLDRWPSPADQRTLSTSDGDTFVVSSGPAGAPPLVLLHGSSGNAASWLGVAAEWSRYFRLHAIDIPGEPGLSTAHRLPLVSGGHTRWLAEVLAALGIPSAAFVGTSLGGRIALDHAIHHPEQVERLALLCPSGIGRRTFGWLPKALLYSLQGEAGRRKLFHLVTGWPGITQETEEYQLFVNRHFRPRQDRITVATDEELATLRMPVLVAVGARDVLLDSAQTRQRLAEHAPQATMYLLPDAGHYVPIERVPVLAFLRAVTASSAPADLG
ncbi:alpha/beta fold hydrolase [Crossiella sp. NPDC003009]